MNFSLVEILGIIIIYQSLFFTAELFFHKKTKPLFVKIMGMICILIVLHFGLMVFESYTGNQYFLGPLFGLMYGPVFYLFFKSLAYEKVSQQKEWWSFIPAIIFLIFFVFTDKVFDFISQIAAFVTIHFLIYLLATLRAIFSYRKKLKMSASFFNDKSLRWLEIILYIQLSIIIATIFESYYAGNSTGNLVIVAIYVLALVLIVCFYYFGLKHVAVFSGVKEEGTIENKKSEYSIANKTFDEYIRKLDLYMDKEKPYLEFNLSLQELSKELGISQRNLSHIINTKHQKNFYDYVNSFRIKLAKTELKDTSKSIKEIMYDSGFSNKGTFNAVFKKVTQMTPTEFKEKK